MSERNLGSLQVAALLVSASYGIGFLFGSGELALQHGMAGSIYGVATAVGMFALALVGRRLWAAGVPVWEWFGRAYGSRLQRAVALLSVVWMAGVLAAQIHGGAAVAGLLGLSQGSAFVVVLLLIFLASRLDLRFASMVFAMCLLSSAVVLVYALVVTGGWSLYLRALPAFSHDLATFSGPRLLAVTLAVGLLVCTGADYHQFVLAARRPSGAVAGCFLAGIALIAIGFLPSALVVTMQQAGALGDLPDSKQVIPLLLARVAGALGPGTDKVMLVALSTAALGSGAAILRAMASALASAVPATVPDRHPALALCALGLGAAVASRGQGIIDTMVSVNVVYIASIAICLVALMRGMVLSPRRAAMTMAAGFVASVAVYIAGWAGWLARDPDFISLVAGLGTSAMVAASLAFGAAPVPRAPRPGS
ncbi:MAG: hypothetical protein MUF16_07755 [Burkholderiaceae bacterium]|nr:hypothetical protein [Burkholderiaceae bacterium]